MRVKGFSELIIQAISDYINFRVYLLYLWIPPFEEQADKQPTTPFGTLL